MMVESYLQQHLKKKLLKKIAHQEKKDNPTNHMKYQSHADEVCFRDKRDGRVQQTDVHVVLG